MPDPSDPPSSTPSPPLTGQPAADRADRADRTNGPAGFQVDLTGASAAEALAALKANVGYWLARGRYHKVRIKRGGKPVLPDIPVGALVALEAATFLATGPLRAAVVNVVGRALFEVELINEAEGFYRTGLEHLLAGDLADAERDFLRALAVDDRFVRAHLQMGVLRKMQGRKADAVAHFERVVHLDRHSDAGREAKIHLVKLREPTTGPTG
jgi:tetratricopeptide (TPR) repeat protein